MKESVDLYLELRNRNRLASALYDDLNITMFYLSSSNTSTYFASTIVPGFYQDKLKPTKVNVQMHAHGLPGLLQMKGKLARTNFRVNVESIVRFDLVSTAVVGFCWREYYVIYHQNLLYVIGNFGATGFYCCRGILLETILCHLPSKSPICLVFSRSLTNYNMVFSPNEYFLLQGLWLMWMFNPYNVKWLLVIILVLLAFGTSRTNLVDNVLTDLVKDIDISQDEEQANARAAFWCNIAEVSGAISATMWVANDSIGVQDSWRTTFLICIIFMMATVVIFAKGYEVYHQDELIQRPITIFLRVCRGWFRKLFKSNRG
nr:proton-dependent oligopeptide transporter family [Tanacetum cinerariifolium]